MLSWLVKSFASLCSWGWSYLEFWTKWTELTFHHCHFHLSVTQDYWEHQFGFWFVWMSDFTHLWASPTFWLNRIDFQAALKILFWARVSSLRKSCSKSYRKKHYFKVNLRATHKKLNVLDHRRYLLSCGQKKIFKLLWWFFLILVNESIDKQTKLDHEPFLHGQRYITLPLLYLHREPIQQIASNFYLQLLKFFILRVLARSNDIENFNQQVNLYDMAILLSLLQSSKHINCIFNFSFQAVKFEGQKVNMLRVIICGPHQLLNQHKRILSVETEPTLFKIFLYNIFKIRLCTTVLKHLLSQRERL